MKKLVLLFAFSALVLSGCNQSSETGSYMAVDLHHHTNYTDGTEPISYVLSTGPKFNLDIIVNAEHGGVSPQNKDAHTWMDEYGVKPEDIKGDEIKSNAQRMWRWQNIKDFSFQKVKEFNEKGTSSLAIQGLEWNPPGYAHAIVGIIDGQFDAKHPNADVVAQFGYMFDDRDLDQAGGEEFGWVKSTKSGVEKTREGAEWLQKNYPRTSWIAPAHPDHRNKWFIDAYRDLNDIAPDVFTAFEGIPGHQATLYRGGIDRKVSYKDVGSFGGVGIQTAQIGGVWDAMISEGRRFWLIASSDFHSHVNKGGGDFYPGEYQKTYIFMKNKTAQALVDGLRSGNIFCVQGGLIDRLEFTAGTAAMGETYHAKNSDVQVRILVRNPETPNHNTYSSMNIPVLNHIDLIAGEMRPKVAKGTDEYSKGEYEKVKVIARFDAQGGISDDNGITSVQWQDLGDGVKLIEYTVSITNDTYFRLRGTNNGLNVPERTDANGNPLESPIAADGAEAAKNAFEDLWFYSNPIFVRK